MAGPGEGTVIGNVLMLVKAVGKIDTMQQLREVVEKSFPTETFVPGNTAEWDEAYARYLKLIEG